MILAHPHSPARRRSAFTLLEILVVVAIILVLASVSTVAVLKVLKDQKNDTAKMQAGAISKAYDMYIIKHDGNPPNALTDVLPYLKDATEQSLIDPWGKQYQVGQKQANEITEYYIYTSNEEGVEIRSDTKK